MGYISTRTIIVQIIITIIAILAIVWASQLEKQGEQVFMYIFISFFWLLFTCLWLIHYGLIYKNWQMWKYTSVEDTISVSNWVKLKVEQKIENGFVLKREGSPHAKSYFFPKNADISTNLEFSKIFQQHNILTVDGLNLRRRQVKAQTLKEKYKYKSKD